MKLAALWFQPSGRGLARRIADLDSGRRLGLCVSPDGSYMLSTQFQTRADLMLVKHFR